MSSPPPSLSIVQRRPGVAQVTMSRPQVFNAFDEAMIGGQHECRIGAAQRTQQRTEGAVDARQFGADLTAADAVNMRERI